MSDHPSIFDRAVRGPEMHPGRRPRSLRPRFESLEQRICLTVGTTPPEPPPPGTASTTTLVLSQSATTYGTEVTLIAIISSPDHPGFADEGSVTFTDNGTDLGTVDTVTAPSSQFRSATFRLETTLPAGLDSLVASYSGYSDASGDDWDPSTSPTVQDNISPAPLTVTADPEYRVVGDADPTLTATYSGFVDSEGPSDLGGALTITDGEGPDASPGIYPGALTPSGLTSSNYAISFVPGTLVIGEDVASTTGLTSVTTLFGQPVTYEATVLATAAVNSPTPTGFVQFKVDGVDDGPPVAVAADGTAVSPTATAPTPAVGTHQVEADYEGDAIYGPSQMSAPETVTAAETTTTFAGSTTTVTYGQTATITATVAAVAPSLATPSGGSIQFFVDGAPDGSPVAVANSAASITIPASLLTPGSHSITAAYGGTTNFAASSGSASVVVSAARTTTSVATRPNKLAYTHRSVTFTATVTSNAPGPSGSVQFQVDGSDIGAPVPLVNGSASLISTPANPGLYTVEAVFSPGAGFAGSTGSTEILVVPGLPKLSVAVPTAPPTGATAAPSPVTFLGPDPGEQDEIPDPPTIFIPIFGAARTSGPRGPAVRTR